MKGLYPSSKHYTASVQVSRLSSKYYQKLIIRHQSHSPDSLEPTYSCPAASKLLTSIRGSNPAWTQHLSRASSLFDKLDSVSGIESPDTAGWHTSFDHYFDNLSSKLCHSKALPCSRNDTTLCVTREEVSIFDLPRDSPLNRISSQANEVFRLGQWEYSYTFRDAPASTRYSTLRYGAYIKELRAHLLGAREGGIKYRHNVAHDGSISPLLGILQVDEMVWPGE